MNSLLELLAARRHQEGGYAAPGPGGNHRLLTFGELFETSGASARTLCGLLAGRSDGAHPFATAVLAVEDPLAFTTAFFAVMRAGLVPVPAPGRISDHHIHRRRLESLVASARPAVVVTEQGQIEAARTVLGAAGPLVVSAEELATGSPSARRGSEPSPDPVAYVQYTSGSTADPKPVALGHERVLAHLAQAARVYEESADCVSVNWVPLHHAMGLVTSVLRPLYSGYTSVILDPTDFVRAPERWMSALTRWRATHTSASDFGYALAARRAQDTGTLDLSRLRVARVSGEMIRAETLDAFTHAFAPAGFSRDAFCPSYGLAEATLTVTSSPVGQAPRIVTASRTAWRGGRFTPATDPGDALRLVSCGLPLDGTQVVILDAHGVPVAGPDQVGEVWISGPQVSDRPGPRISGLEGLHTGDSGFLHQGELVLVGRSAERFQVRGVNYYCTELESAVAAADPRFRPGRIAAFVSGSVEESQRLVIAAETGTDRPPSPAETAELSSLVVRTISREVGLSVQDVLILPAESLPLTASGKLQRGQCRSLFESRGLDGFTV